MKKKNTEEALPEQPEAVIPETVDEEKADGLDIKSLFARHVNGTRQPVTINMKRMLTRTILTVAQEKELVFTCTGDVYVMQLQVQSRGGELSDVRVVDGRNEADATDCTLMVDDLIAAAFVRGGFKTFIPNPVTSDAYYESIKGNDSATGDWVAFIQNDGDSLIGHSFAFRESLKKSGGGYRAIECVEVEITTA